MAARADVARDILLGHRRVGIGVALDGVNAVAIGAGGGERIAARDRLAVNAPLKVLATSVWHLPQVDATENF
jgi:hypothetical protein